MLRSPSATTKSWSMAAFLRTESTMTHSISGRARASGMAGTPPPEPRSTTAAGEAASISGSAASASSRWRRATSAGATRRVRLSLALASSRRRTYASTLAAVPVRQARRQGREVRQESVELPVRRSRGIDGMRQRPAVRGPKGNASSGGVSVFPVARGLDGRLSHRPRGRPVTVLGRRGSRTATIRPCDVENKVAFPRIHALFGRMWISRAHILVADAVPMP